MANSSDHEGKSATSSAANSSHSSQQNHNDGHGNSHQQDSAGPFQTAPAPDSIAVRAHEIWLENGRPHGTAEQDWLEAEQELQTGAKSKNLIDEVHRKAGSVQA